MSIFTKKTAVSYACNAILAGGILTIFIWLSIWRLGIVFDFSFIGNFSKRIGMGFVMTLEISICSLFLSLAIGILAAVLQSCRILFLKYLALFYVQFIRGTPLIMQIYLFFYIIGTAWGIDNRFVSGVLILSLFEGAYIAEIVRAGIADIEKTQIEAAKAVGFSNHQTIRFVILPQMVASTLPPLAGQFSSIIKDSSLLSMIAVIELTQTMREISALNFKLFECYLFLGILYLVLTLPLSLFGKYLEKRYAFEH